VILDGTYRLLRVVGEGAMGVVYEATHARLAGRYAIKVLTPQLAESAEGPAQFGREARNTSLMQHPNVVQVIDHNTAPDGTEYLVMEYLVGDSLAQRLEREGRLSLAAVADIVEQIAAGLSAAHARGIVHRDLKPENVVLVPVEGRRTELVKILDFGISKRQGSLELSGLVCGTPQYMAPEQAEGRILDVGPATDQFALAVIAHELLTGCNPFAADTVGATFVRVSSHSPPTVGFGERVDAVLARALSKASRERFRSVAAFSEAFQSAALAWGRADKAPATVAAMAGRGDARGRKMRWRRGMGRTALGAAALAITVFLVAPSRTVIAPQARPLVTPPLAAVHVAAPPAVEPRIVVLTASATLPAQADRAGSFDTRMRATRTRDTRTRRSAARGHPAPRIRAAISVDEDATLPPTEIAAQAPLP